MRDPTGGLTCIIARATADGKPAGRMTGAVKNKVVRGVQIGPRNGVPGGRAAGSPPTVDLLVRTSTAAL